MVRQVQTLVVSVAVHVAALFVLVVVPLLAMDALPGVPTLAPVDGLPKTAAWQANIMRLPGFPSASRELLTQYAEAFAKVHHWATTRAGAAA